MSSPTTIDVLRSVSPEGATSFMDHRAAVMDNPALQAIPVKDELHVVHAAVDHAGQGGRCQRCGDHRGNARRTAGVKMATVNATAGEALASLGSQH